MSSNARRVGVLRVVSVLLVASGLLGLLRWVDPVLTTDLSRREEK
jgi:hypothetical protein